MELIEKSGVLIGKSIGICATSMPESSVNSFHKLFLLGIGLHKSKPVTISAEAIKHFHKVKPIVFFSFLKYKGGTHATAPGTLVKSTGKFTPSKSIWYTYAWLYGADVAIISAAGIVIVVAIKQAQKK